MGPILPLRHILLLAAESQRRCRRREEKPSKGASAWGPCKLPSKGQRLAAAPTATPLNQVAEEQRKGLHQRPLDLGLILLLLMAGAFTLFRGLVGTVGAGRAAGRAGEGALAGNAGLGRVSLSQGAGLSWQPHALCLVPQVVLDCPSESCFNYMYQYEPYLRDPVAYPKVQVSAGLAAARAGSPPGTPCPEHRVGGGGRSASVWPAG